MCGILGGFYRNSSERLEERFNSGLEALAHRGPDDRGLNFFQRPDGALILGHTRLSIIDLSSAGHQPMCSLDTRYSLVFNGEIYNYRELRKELETLGAVFVSDSDTEVLLAAWIAWGRECLARLVGMFAFVICDHSEGTLTCVRDAFGIKPLFYAHSEEDHSFVFASELPALLALREKTPYLNLQRAYDYLVHGIQDSNGDTFVENVHHLRPAHVMTFDLTSCAVVDNSAWWRPTIKERSTLSFQEAAQTLRELFLNSISLHLRSDVPIGAALSGGIDSSALVCGIRHLEPELPIHSFSYIADGNKFSEEKWVDLVNKHVVAKIHKVSIDVDDLGTDLPDLIRVQGEPFNSTSMYAQFRIFSKAQQSGVPVILEGQGADELLAGYEGYPGQRMRSLLEQHKFKQLFKFAKSWQKVSGRQLKSPWKSFLGQMLPEDLHLKALKYADHTAAPGWLNQVVLKDKGVTICSPWMGRTKKGNGRRVVEALAHSLTDHELPSLLRFGDRNAMRFSVENRVPFLTVQLADFLLSLPEEYLISNDGETKHVFRAAMRGIVPDAILDRKDKIGFVTPMQEWLGPIASYIKETIQASTHFSFLMPDRMQHEVDKVLDGSRQLSPQIWRMINLVIWARQFNVKESFASP